MAGQITDSLIEAMKIMSNDDKENAYECTIIRSIDSMTGEYELDYMSNKIRAYSMDSSKTYSPGDLVFVIAPQGDFNDVKYILGFANSKKIAAPPGKEDESDEYVNLTDDLLDVDKDTDIFGLKSYEDIDMKDITSGVCNNSRFIDIITKYINGKKERILKFSADIKTSLDNEQMYSGGEYGISISIPFVGEGYKEYKLDSTKMLGSPMSLLDWTPQTLDIQLDKNKIYDSTRPPIVKIYKEKFIKDEEKVPEDFDIKFKNVSLYVMGKLTPEEFNGYYVHLFATRGNYFLSSDSFDAVKYITATLKAKGNDVDTTNDDIYWFEEDPKITSSSPEYLEVGGIGWKCINPTTKNKVTNEDGTTSSTISFKNRVEKIEVKAKTIQGNKRYKCVIVHNKIPYFNEIVIYKGSSNFELVLESLSGEKISIHETDVELKLKFYYKGITENPDYALKVVYDWTKEDKNGVKDDNFQKHLHFSKKNGIVKEGTKTYYVTTVDFPTEIIDEYAVIRVKAYIDGIIPDFEDFKTEEKHYIGSTDVEITIIEEEEDPALEDIKKSIPRLLFDYNIEDVVVKQASSIIASITCKVLRKTDVQGHFLMNFVATEYCNVILRFMDNDMTELFCPLTYTVQPGHNSIGVPHSYLFRLAGLHSFTVSAQCTNGQLNIPIRGILYTIDSGYLVERTLNMTADVLDLSLSQTNIHGIDEFWTIGIENKVAVLKSHLFEAEDASAWKIKYNFGDVEDASIDFNGYWTQRNDDAYTLITDKWPFVAIVDKEGFLKIYTYNEDSAEYVAQQLDTNVKQVSLCRGYSSTIYPEQDQGMVCAYVKNDNTVWYTHYSYDAAMKKAIWYESTHIDGLSDVLHVSVNRTNDYRIGICVTAKNENKWYLTERTYVNQAIRPEKRNLMKIDYKKILFYMGPNVELKTTATQYELPECEEAPNILYGTYDGPIIFYPDVDQKSLFTVYLDDVKTSNFSVYNDGTGKLGVCINQSMTGIRKIRVIFNNDNRDAYISRGRIEYGWHATGYDFTWTPMMTYRISSNGGSFNIRSTATAANIEYKPILKTKILNKEQLNIGVNADSLVQLFELREIEKKILENASVNISIDSASVVQSQTGESPI